MSELRVDTLKPALNPSKITITPGVVVEDNTGVEQFEVTSSGEIKVLGPLRVGSAVSNTTGSNSQVLTSQGTGLPPVWAEGFPVGGIIMWYGLSSTIPLGWKLCDGQTWNGFKTPDLRDRFVVGAGTSYTVNQIGGSKDSALLAHTHTITPASHTHYGRYSFKGSDNYSEGFGHNAIVGIMGNQDNQATVNTNAEYKLKANSANATYPLNETTLTIGTAGSATTTTNANLPPYYSLCYIMRVPTS